jgi:ABC-type glycerol-3-phosphate transport system permease component
MALRKRPAVTAIQYFVLVVALVFFLTPIFFQVIAGFRKVGETYDPDKIVDFRGLTLDTWKDTIENQGFLHYLKNSLIASVGSTLLIMLFSIPASYGLAKLPMGKKTRANLTFEFLSMRMLPGIAVIIPIFVAFKVTGLLYTMQGLILLYVVFNIPFATWILTGFFREVSNEITEAAKIDGCTPFTELMKIVLPLSGPGILSVTILTFIFTWNEFMFASILTMTSTRTLPVWAAYTTQQHYIISYPVLGISFTVMIVPVVIFALTMQRYLVRGLSFGAVKE